MKKIIITLLLITLTFGTKAQFEQKMTMQLSAGYSVLLGDDIGEYYKNGITLDGGLQYNFNRDFSLIALIKYGTYFIKKDEYNNMEGKFNNLGISICPKYKFIKDKAINPYVYGGFNLNYIKYSYDFSGEYFEYKEPLSFGFLIGVGAELQINDNFTPFSQIGISHINTDSDYKINSFFIQFGVNINMFKSKTL